MPPVAPAGRLFHSSSSSGHEMEQQGWLLLGLRSEYHERSSRYRLKDCSVEKHIEFSAAYLRKIISVGQDG
jgi:hypothetical protein